ncbi:MAG: TonB-dependent receptor [Cyanobacteria bacterium P01_A01_bin.116]
MDKETKNKFLHSGVAASALAGLGLLPGVAEAQAVLDIGLALETSTDSPSDVGSLEGATLEANVEVRTREVEWDVPWIAAAPEEVVLIDDEFLVSAPPLATGFAEEAAIAQAAKSNFPLIAVIDEPSAVSSLSPVDIASETLIAQAASAEASESFSLESLRAAQQALEIEELAQVDSLESLETAAPSLEITSETVLEDAPLIAFASEEETSLETVSPLLAIATPEANQTPQLKAPWLARALSVEEPAIEAEKAETLVPLIALRSAAAEEEEESAEPWIAYAANNGDEDEEENNKAPWLVRSLQAEAQQGQSTSQVPRLSLSLPRREASKRPADWISLTPVDLEQADSDNFALRSRTEDGLSTTGAEAYDVSNLLQVAITPADLANPDELAVSVDASQVEILSPEPGAFLDIPATPVVLRFPIGANIALLTNGQVVDSSLVGRTETDPETQLRTQTWYGVPLVSGENTLEVISTDDGSVLQSLFVSVRGQPDKLVLLSPRSIPSDGRSTASIRGQLVDESGNISRWDSIATLQSSDGRFIGADQDPDVPGFQVEVQRGEFTAELQSSLDSKLVQLRANASGFEAFSQIQFDTPQRPSLVSGVIDVRLGASGTDFYDSYREFLPVNGDDSYEFDVDAAVFATGNLGEWLYTGAYNSDRSLNENCRGESTLFRTSSGDCTNVYPTYGDNSYSDVVAPSLDSVYLRLERNSPSNNAGIDYAMWGDYNTEEFSSAAQLFTSTSRQLHGFKGNYNFGNLSVTGLYADNVEGFQRDTISPDGTSGFYFTSQRNIVPGSEDVFLELEELERPGAVLDRVQLARGADYEIDYDRGTLLFNDPITRTSIDDFGQLLVRRIVTTYQHEDGEDTNILAGRLRYNFGRDLQGQDSWLGASYLTEDQGNRDFTLYGADAQIALGDSATLTAEIAESSNDFDISDNVGGTAYRVELDGDIGKRLNGSAYFRSTDPGFSNRATTSFVPGQTRYGAQLAGRLGDNTSVRAQYDHEDNNGTAPQVITDLSELLAGINRPGAALDNSLTTYSFGISQRLGRANAEIDWIHRDRTDRLNNDSNLSSDQIRSRFTTPLGNKLTLVAQNELNLSSNVDPIYPSRTLIGLNWEAMRGINVGLNQIFYGGGGNNRGSSTSLDVTGEHTFKSDTTVRGRFSTVDGRQIGGSIGLEQGIRLAPGLNLDLGYEKVFSTFGNETAASTQFSQPYATGTGASALGLSGGESYSVGLSYTDNPDFQASTRFEHRNSSQSSNTVFDLSALGRINPSLTVLGDYRLASAANQNVTGLGTTSLLKLGLAYRNPDNDRFNALLRYEHRMNPNTIPTTASIGTSTETQEHLLSAEAIYAPNWRWELYGKYALRNSRTEISSVSNSFSGSNTVQLAQMRATYRLAYKWDVVGEARWLGGNGFNETGYSIEGGYYPLPDLRLSAGYSGGAADRDFGENRDSGGFYIGATAKLSGLLNGFGTQPNAPSQQAESAIEVSHETLVPVGNVLNTRDASPQTAETLPSDEISEDAESLEDSRTFSLDDLYPSAVEF